MIDLHCHLDLYQNPVEIIEECERRGIYVLSVTNTPSAWPKTNELASKNRRIKTALGLHPQLAGERKGELKLFNQLIGETRYIGEVGLDGSKENKSFWNDQKEVFEHILSKCEESGGKILSIHSRNAAREVLETLKDYPHAGQFILHWFSGSLKELKDAIDLGCWFSVNPIMFNSKKGVRLIESMPKDRLLLETDGPFTNTNGSPLMPWNSIDVIWKLSNIWSDTKENVQMQVMANFLKVINH